MPQSPPCSDILFDRHGPLGLVTLNRPQALNALTLSMILAFDRQLAAWQRDDTVKAVVVRGIGRAFCAGGDVVHIWESELAARTGHGDRGAPGREVFAAEYRLDRRTAKLGKPYVALLDGHTLGGGVGISVHGSHAIATENTRFAMPECAIGLFPDIGASHVLPRCPGAIGTWMALTGARLLAADLLEAGLVRAQISSTRQTALIEALAAADWSGSAFAVVDSVVADHAAPPAAPTSTLAAHRTAIDRCFGFDRVEDIVAALQREGNPWADAQRAAVDHASPTSLKVTLKEMRLGAGLDIDEALCMEYRLSQACLAGHDFFEGVRAMLVDKDKSPRWQPPALDEVEDALVDWHFNFRPDPELTFSDEAWS